MKFGVLLAWIATLLIHPLGTSAGDRYKSAAVDAQGRLQIVRDDGRVTRIALRREQVGFSRIAISEDRSNVGWAEDYPNCCTSYPIPSRLVIYRGGRVIRIFGTYPESSLPIWWWRFESRASRISFHVETTHGSIGVRDELREIRSGKLIAAYDGEPQPDAPDWVKRLKSSAIPPTRKPHPSTPATTPASAPAADTH